MPLLLIKAKNQKLKYNIFFQKENLSIFYSLKNTFRTIDSFVMEYSTKAIELDVLSNPMALKLTYLFYTILSWARNQRSGISLLPAAK